MEEEVVKVEQHGSTLELTINRPKALNALNLDVLVALSQAFERAGRDNQLRAVIITGAGEKAFVAGADIAGMVDLGPRPIADYIELGQRVMRQIEKFQLPVIAAVNGFALGGGLELALACDMVVAARNAKLGTPEVSLAIIPGFGGTQRLIQRCGIGQARRLVLTGELIDADEAARIGVIEKVVESADLLTQARAWGDMVSKKGPLAVMEGKSVIARSQEQSLLSGLQLEVEAFLKLFGTSDREEGMRAFMQKREAKFVGK